MVHVAPCVSSLRKWIAVGVILGSCGFLGLMLYLLNCCKETGPDTLRVNLFIASCMVGAGLAVFGLITRRTWGRWLGLATGLCGLTSITTAMATISDTRASFIAWFFAGAAALLILVLSGPSMAEYLGARGNPFVTGGRRAKLLSLSIVLSLAATPTLWGYALLGRHEQTTLRWVAFAAAGSLCLGVLLITRQRTAGLLALLVGGGLALAIYFLSGERYVTWSQGAPWLLASVGATVAIVATARPVGRVLAGKPLVG